jgi:hypothetical protein
MERQVPEFSTILKTVVALAVLSALLAVAVTVVGGSNPSALAVDLVHAFIESFKACLFAVLGLLGGWAATIRRKNQPTNK